MLYSTNNLVIFCWCYWSYKTQLVFSHCYPNLSILSFVSNLPCFANHNKNLYCGCTTLLHTICALSMVVFVLLVCGIFFRLSNLLILLMCTYFHHTKFTSHFLFCLAASSTNCSLVEVSVSIYLPIPSCICYEYTTPIAYLSYGTSTTSICPL